MALFESGPPNYAGMGLSTLKRLIVCVRLRDSGCPQSLRLPLVVIGEAEKRDGRALKWQNGKGLGEM